ncbi:uncharacterized protein F5891DRAFT_1277635 [Suillus fuscotomentosus]|uniref:Uncharacterized protein n=1 Tax=Suillus fuscotomentosus TaxID=1912939 RepID=A0AAD4HNF0_9AGAM|nr:uncharacterized protein F5891DRAFT_1277635 [Suillus fuscotomentosus]KAG1901649.1 hypothetical protein F5891DRAFT_1277635 [Suillus fuscotomentosus]
MYPEWIYDRKPESFVHSRLYMEGKNTIEALMKYTERGFKLKLTKRLNDIIQESSALKSHLVQQLKNLSNAVPELVNFDISLAQQVIPHLSDARSAKAPFQLATVLSYARQTATSTVAKDMKPGTSCFEAVGEAIAQLSAECNKLLPLAMEPENVFKSRLLLALIFVKYHANDGQVSGTPPWVLRIEEIRARMTTNVEAEQKAAQLQEEIQGLSRSLKTKDQVIQKSEVKIEHMERRMEAVKEQADLDMFEQDNAKLKALVAGSERQAASTQPVDSENVPMEGNVETPHLLEQIKALRGTVRFLRTENSYLKGQDLLKEIQALPHLPEHISRVRTPPLDPSGQSDTDESDTELPPAPPTIRSLATETKVLYRDIIKFSSSPHVDAEEG